LLNHFMSIIDFTQRKFLDSDENSEIEKKVNKFLGRDNKI